MSKRPDPAPVPRVRGRLLLLKWFNADRTTRTRVGLGQRLGVSGQAVSRWVTGAARPEGHIRSLLAIVTGVPADEWMTPAERKGRAVAIERAVQGADLPRTGTEG